jgi:hypothetical protein
MHYTEVQVRAEANEDRAEACLLRRGRVKCIILNSLSNIFSSRARLAQNIGPNIICIIKGRKICTIFFSLHVY